MGAASLVDVTADAVAHAPMLGAAADRPRLVAVPSASTERDFLALYQAEAPRLAAYARVLLGTARRSDVDDALQDAWMRAWRAWPTTEVSQPAAWLRQIVRNSCMDRHRRHRPQRSLDDEMFDLPVPAGDDTVLDGMEARDALAVLDRLPVALRETLWLRAVLDLRYEEIGAIQQIPVGTVMSRLHAARRKVSAQLRRQGR